MSQSTFQFQEDKKIYSVSELNRLIKNLLRKEVGSIWLSGEVSRPTYHGSGHLYFSLKDKNSQISAACFRRDASKLKFRLEQGMEVVVYGEVSVYEPRGDYQIIVRKIEPRGVGALQLAFEQLKEKLEQEGLFDESAKKDIPFLPARIGVVTSPTGAAIRDILNVTRRRFPPAHITIFPASVQGDGAAEQIAEGIRTFNSDESLNNVEVLIVGRGGGSIEDLWPFNEEVVARAIFESRIPVISSVGHEIDFTISDFVSDLRAPTPSAAGELVLPEMRDLTATLKNYRRRLALALKNKLERNKMELFEVYRSYGFRNFVERLNERAQRADELAARMTRAARYLFNNAKDKTNAAAARLEGLSPLKVLARGYSVTTGPDGRPVTSAGNLKPGDMLRTKLEKGEVSSRVEEITENGEKET